MLVNVSELYKLKAERQSPTFKKVLPSKYSRSPKYFSSYDNPQLNINIDYKQVKDRQLQIKKNNDQISKIIQQKKFYLKHKPIFEQEKEVEPFYFNSIISPSNNSPHIVPLKGSLYANMNREANMSPRMVLDSDFVISSNLNQQKSWLIRNQKDTKFNNDIQQILTTQEDDYFQHDNQKYKQYLANSSLIPESTPIKESYQNSLNMKKYSEQYDAKSTLLPFKLANLSNNQFQNKKKSEPQIQYFEKQISSKVATKITIPPVNFLKQEESNILSKNVLEGMQNFKNQLAQQKLQEDQQNQESKQNIQTIQSNSNTNRSPSIQNLPSISNKKNSQNVNNNTKINLSLAGIINERNIKESSKNEIKIQDLDNFSQILDQQMKKISKKAQISPKSGSTSNQNNNYSKQNENKDSPYGKDLNKNDSVSEKSPISFSNQIKNLNLQKINVQLETEEDISPKKELDQKHRIVKRNADDQSNTTLYKNYYKNTKNLIDQAMQVLDGEKAYNDANLDKYLMGIKNIKPEKKSLPKVLPQIHNDIGLKVKLRNKLSKADETFYKNYSALNEGILEHHKEKFNNENDIPFIPDKPILDQLKADASKNAQGSLQRYPNSYTVKRPKIPLKREDSHIILDYAMNNRDTEAGKILYKQTSDLTDQLQSPALTKNIHKFLNSNKILESKLDQYPQISNQNAEYQKMQNNQSKQIYQHYPEKMTNKDIQGLSPLDNRSTYIVPIGQMLDQYGKLKYTSEGEHDQYDQIYSGEHQSTLMKKLQHYKKSPINDLLKVQGDYSQTREGMLSTQVNFKLFNFDRSEWNDEKSHQNLKEQRGSILKNQQLMKGTIRDRENIMQSVQDMNNGYQRIGQTQTKFKYEQIYGESIINPYQTNINLNQKGKLQNPEKSRKDSKGGEDFTQYVKDNMNNTGLLVIQEKKGKSLSRISDLFDDDDTNEKQHSSKKADSIEGRSQKSEDENAHSRHDLRLNNQLSAIQDWHGHNKISTKQIQKNRDYIIEQWEDEDEFIENNRDIHLPHTSMLDIIVNQENKQNEIENIEDDQDLSKYLAQKRN